MKGYTFISICIYRFKGLIMYYIFQKIRDSYHQTIQRKIKPLIINCPFIIINKKLFFMDKPLYCLLITSKRTQTNKSWTDLNFHCLKNAMGLYFFTEPENSHH